MAKLSEYECLGYTLPISEEEFQLRTTILSELLTTGAISKKVFKKRHKLLVFDRNFTDEDRLRLPAPSELEITK